MVSWQIGKQFYSKNSIANGRLRRKMYKGSKKVPF
jgi:hypothetical protein